MVSNPFKNNAAASSLSGPPSSGDYLADSIFRTVALTCAALLILLIAYILWEIGGKAMPAMQEHGLSFITGTTWNVNKAQFGVLPEIWGTLYSSLLALIIGGIFGITIAIFLTQDFIGPRIAAVFR